MRTAALLLKLYDGLALQEAVQPVDLIFVLAGRMERKRYGLDLYRQGVAPRLVLSIGRFEVSKMSALGLDAFDRLKALRDQTPPGDRHFFLEMRGAGACIENTALPAWNTYGEVVGLRRLLERQSAGKVMVVSTDVHLRRVAMTIERVFRDVPVRFRYCAVPFPISELQRENWWARREQRRFVLSEALKLAAYRAVFCLPEPVMRRLMGMRRRGSRQK